MDANQPSLFPAPLCPLPEGFRYCAAALTALDENRLLARMGELPFKEFQFHGFEGKRRVVSFGWRYDYDTHKLLPADLIPSFLQETCRKVEAALGSGVQDVQQVLVTEYAPGAPIGWHKDRPVFEDVMGLSLGSSCMFRLRKRLGNKTWERANIRLAPRSVYLLSGPARWEWEHSIPPMEARRYSITFRSLRRL